MRVPADDARAHERASDGAGARNTPYGRACCGGRLAGQDQADPDGRPDEVGGHKADEQVPRPHPAQGQSQQGGQADVAESEPGRAGTKLRAKKTANAPQAADARRFPAGSTDR